MMKKIAITCALLSSLVASSVWADAASDLKSRLDKVSSFHASFTQKVTDGSGAAVQEGQGDLWVKRPNLFIWQNNILTTIATRFVFHRLS
jgi:outer membrane lipoprotein carrier protein